MPTTTTNPVQTQVYDYALALCEALRQDYKACSYRMIKSGNESELSEYAKGRLAQLDNDEVSMRFRIESGRKFYKIIQQDERDGSWRDGSVHAFITKTTGDVYKPASWKAPAKHVRYDLRIIRHREFLHNPANTDWAGGHLYMR